MDNRIFVPDKYGMEICSVCKSHGYIQKPKRQPCPKCGGFGFTKKETGKIADRLHNSLKTVDIRPPALGSPGGDKKFTS